MNRHRWHRRFIISLVIAGNVWLLAGCGSVAAAGTNNPIPVKLSSNTLNFEKVVIGISKTLPDTISNNTSAPVTIKSIQGLGTIFQVTGITLPLELAPGESASFSVQLQPTAPGEPSTTITFVGPTAQTSAVLSAFGNAVTLGKLSPNPLAVAFGNTKVGANQTSNVTLSNSGETDVTVLKATLSGAGFTLSNLQLPVTLPAGTAASATITFVPTVAGNFSGSVLFATQAHQITSNVVLSFAGTGVTSPLGPAGSLTAGSPSLTFASTQVGSNSSQSATLTNTGSAAVTISQATSSGAGFSMNGLTVPAVLASNQSITFTTTFAPANAGTATGSLTVMSDATNSQLNIALSGTGTAAGQLSVSPTSLGFGNLAVGSSASLSGSLTAGGASVTITAASLNNSEFVLSGISLPATLAAGQSTPFVVTFKPQASGATSASLSFASNATNATTQESISGAGTATAQHTVSLTWNASTNAVGYNIYRAAASGGPYATINPSPNDTTAYTDNTVVPGQTYYYVATAVDSNSDESGYSNETQAVIPNP